MDIKQKLDELDELICALEVLKIQKQQLLDAVIPPEVKLAINEIEDEFADKEALAQEKIDALTADIRQAVIDHGETVKGKHLQAVYTKGRVLWDTDKLEAMAGLIPQIAAARRFGQPSATIRKLG